jgi:hypothetical protein
LEVGYGLRRWWFVANALADARGRGGEDEEDSCRRQLAVRRRGRRRRRRRWEHMIDEN